MKANISANTQIPQQTNGAPITLSIGMIVKNEEQHLDNCLSALQKLRDNVNNELIIVDTGSTDRTKEIAKKYTDKVYDFEWIDDFAAARNFGLEKATGEWFMFLDADEYTDKNCERLITFFNDKALNSKYNSATYIQRNYFERGGGEYGDFPVIRIVRRTPETRFEGIIHEKLFWLAPLYHTDVPFHHYGYVTDDNGSVIKAKQKRNMPLLLKIYENDKNSAQCVCEIIDSCCGEKDEIKWTKRLCELIDLPENKRMVNSAYMKMLRCYLIYNMNDEILNTAEKFLSISGNADNACVLYVYIARALAYTNMNRQSEAAENYEKYLAAYKRYKNNELDMADTIFAPIYGTSDIEYRVTLFDYVKLCLSSERYEKALCVLGMLDVKGLAKNVGHTAKYISAYINTARAVSDITVLKPLIESADDLADIGRDMLIEGIFAAYLDDAALKENTAANMGILKPLPELYSAIYITENKDDISAVAAYINDVSDTFCVIDKRFSEVMYICIKNGIDMTGSIGKAPLHDISAMSAYISEKHNDFALRLNGYIRILPPDTSIKTLLFYVNAFAGSVARVSDDSAKNEIYDNFITVLTDYVLNIYNPQLLNPDDIGVLPELHQFGYYMAVALNAKNNGQTLEYVRALRSALACCESMKPVVEQYIKDI